MVLSFANSEDLDQRQQEGALGLVAWTILIMLDYMKFKWNSNFRYLRLIKIVPTTSSQKRWTVRFPYPPGLVCLFSQKKGQEQVLVKDSILVLCLFSRKL